MSDSSDSEFDDLAKAIKTFDSDNESEKEESGQSEDESDDHVEENANSANIKRKRRKVDELNSEEQKELEKFLFGDKESLIKNLEGNKNIFTDVDGSHSDDQTNTRNPVWEDPDDEDFKKKSLHGESQLKRKFERITGSNPSWAQLDKKKEVSDDDDSDDDFSKTVGSLAKKTTSKSLPKGELEFKRLSNINRASAKEGRITSIEFHPKSTVGIVAGTKGMVSMFSIDGRENKKIHSIEYEKYPIYSCKLNKDGDEMTLGSTDPFFHTYNLLTGYKQRTRLPKDIKNFKSFEISPCGKYMASIGEFGEVHLLHALTKELLCTLKQEYQSTSLSFSMDSNKLFSHSDDNEINIFDLRAQRVEHRFVDEGCVNGTTLSISPNGRFIATGSRQGFVNLYNYEDVFKNKNPKPEKALSNLTTEITELKFNPMSEILAICSVDKNNAVKLVHLPSATVFKNFPVQRDELGKVTTLAFTPASGYFGIGTLSGPAPLYRLRHYSNY